MEKAILDVRTVAEYRAIHVDGSLNIPLDSLEKEKDSLLEKFNPDEELSIMCKAGGRAKKAADKMKKWGFSQLVIIEGGIDQWAKDGKDVVKGESSISLERQVRIAAGAMVAIGGALALAVHINFIAIPIFVGCGLVFAGITNTCGMGMLIAKMPWNK